MTHSVLSVILVSEIYLFKKPNSGLQMGISLRLNAHVAGALPARLLRHPAYYNIIFKKEYSKI